MVSRGVSNAVTRARAFANSWNRPAFSAYNEGVAPRLLMSLIKEGTRDRSVGVAAIEASTWNGSIGVDTMSACYL
jgi:hypothetical protein